MPRSWSFTSDTLSGGYGCARCTVAGKLDMHRITPEGVALKEFQAVIAGILVQPVEHRAGLDVGSVANLMAGTAGLCSKSVFATKIPGIGAGLFLMRPM